MIDVDVKDIQEFINNATGENLSKIQRKSMSAGAKVIYAAAKTNLKTRLPASTHSAVKYYRNSKPVYSNDKLVDAVKMRVYETNDHEYEFKVHTMGVRRKGSATWLARMFANGTKVRKNRGQIKALNFFTDAVNTGGSRAIATMEDTFIKLLKI